jgi:hypothetical protein
MDEIHQMRETLSRQGISPPIKQDNYSIENLKKQLRETSSKLEQTQVNLMVKQRENDDLKQS